MTQIVLKLLRYVWNHPLNVRTGRFAAIARVGRWQLASRLMSGPIGLPFVEGTWIFATRGMAGATGNWYCGLHEAPEMAFVLHLLRPGDHFVDVGANVGSYTILAAGAVRARVTAVEPIPETFAKLERNVSLNALGTLVSCHRMGLSDSEGNLRFTSTLDTVNHVVADGESGSGIDVPVMRLDELVAGRAPVLMKIDVEGHELAVLRGGRKTLSNPRLLAVIMETNGSGARYGVSDDQLRAEMRQFGFEPCDYDPFLRCLVDVMRPSPNTVFVRNREQVQRRVREAPRFRLASGATSI